MLSDVQFETLMEKLSINQQDRERLIRIETIVQMSLESETKSRVDTALKVQEVRASASKAHDRIDCEVKARFIFTGILASIAIVVTVTGAILKLTGHL